MTASASSEPGKILVSIAYTHTATAAPSTPAPKAVKRRGYSRASDTPPANAAR